MEGQVVDLREGHLERERRHRPSRSDPCSLGSRRQTSHRGQAVGHRVHLHGRCRLPGDDRAKPVPRAGGGRQRRPGVPNDLEPRARNPNGADRPHDPAQGTAVVDPTVQHPRRAATSHVPQDRRMARTGGTHAQASTYQDPIPSLRLRRRRRRRTPVVSVPGGGHRHPDDGLPVGQHLGSRTSRLDSTAQL